MDLLKISHKKNRLSDILYVLLNVGLGISVLFFIITTGSPLVSFLLVMISKWRVFAVRPRYWMANVAANFVDFIVGISFVVIIYHLFQPDLSHLMVQVALTVLYIVWLLLVKPRSQEGFIVAQSAIALFLGTYAYTLMTYQLDAVVYVFGMWLIGLSAARHVVTHYEDTHALLYSGAWGLVVAEMAYISHRWLIGYSVPGVSGLYVPQVTIIIMLMSFVAYRLYYTAKHKGKVQVQDVIIPSVFSGFLIVLLLVLFNYPVIGNVV